jgi:hypothetical protein
MSAFSRIVHFYGIIFLCVVQDKCFLRLAKEIPTVFFFHYIFKNLILVLTETACFDLSFGSPLTEGKNGSAITRNLC